MWSAMDISVCRGMYLSAQNTNNRFVQQHGNHVIVLARELKENYCWSRFIFIKELMHLFDDPKEATDSGDAFDKLLSELSGPGTESSYQFQSELKCFWMALAAFCPEENRREFEKQRADGHIDNYGIALQLRIPEQYVPRLFENRYRVIIDQLISEN